MNDLTDRSVRTKLKVGLMSKSLYFSSSELCS